MWGLMETTINIFCDESCHLENDLHDLMVLGAVWCPLDKTRIIAEQLRKIKEQHGLGRNREIKWGSVSPSKIRFYEDLLEFFFRENGLHFRAIIALDKASLKHDRYEQDHDLWYYKMYFYMLRTILDRQHRYRIYVDIKDTRSSEKLRQLRKVLHNNLHDFEYQTIERIQPVRSHEVEQVQLADFLTGIVCAANRRTTTSIAKLALIDLMQSLHGNPLTRVSRLDERKVNLNVNAK